MHFLFVLDSLYDLSVYIFYRVLGTDSTKFTIPITAYWLKPDITVLAEVGIIPI
jgi:hypothetical protein